MDSDPATPRVHVVNDAGNRLVFRSALIQRESDRAVLLEAPLIPTGGYYLKRLFVKGVDLIARTEEEALRLYLEQVEDRLAEMEQTAADLRRRFQEGTERLRSLTSEHPIPGLRD